MDEDDSRMGNVDMTADDSQLENDALEAPSYVFSDTGNDECQPGTNNDKTGHGN